MNKRNISNFIVNNKNVFLFLIITFVIGISSGTICVKTLSDIQKTDLINYLNNFFKIFSSAEIENNKMFVQLLFDNLKVYMIIIFFGLFTIGLIVIPFIVLLKGFILGFTIGFILDELYTVGILFSIFVIFPQNILYIIGLIFSSSIAILMAYNNYNNKRKYSIKRNYKKTMKQYLYYLISVSVGYGVTIIGCSFEAYITPIFMIFFANKLF